MKSDISYSLIWRSFDVPKGRSAARNEGIHCTSGEIIIFLDSDMETAEGFLEAHLKSHQNHPHTACIGRIIWPEGGSFFRYIGTRGVAKLKENDPVPPWYFVTGNASIERYDLPSQSPFDETLPGWGGEDLDLGLKLHNAGVTFMYACEAISLHHFDGNLTTHVDRTFSYGFVTLPILADRYPEIPKILKLNLLDSLLLRFLILPILFYPVFVCAIIFDKLPLPSFLFDYLTFAAYAQGWQKGKKQ